MSTVPYLVLTDMTAGMARPCALDLKIGRRTFEPDAPDDVDEEALDEEIRELALRLRRANEELAQLEPAVDPEPVAKKFSIMQSP